MPACAAFLFASAPRTSRERSASEQPPRIASRSEASAPPSRQTLRLPSASSRSRVQEEQKGDVIDVMNETTPGLGLLPPLLLLLLLLPPLLLLLLPLLGEGEAEEEPERTKSLATPS